jgi:hypothetical protein
MQAGCTILEGNAIAVEEKKQEQQRLKSIAWISIKDHSEGEKHGRKKSN